METRSREPPLTAAKPIYLRPRFFPGFPLLLPRCLLPAAKNPLRNRVCPRHALSLSRYVRLSFAVALPRVRVRSRIVSYTGIFHFSVLPRREKQRVVPCQCRGTEGMSTRRVKIRFLPSQESNPLFTEMIRLTKSKITCDKYASINKSF